MYHFYKKTHIFVTVTKMNLLKFHFGITSDEATCLLYIFAHIYAFTIKKKAKKRQVLLELGKFIFFSKNIYYFHKVQKLSVDFSFI